MRLFFHWNNAAYLVPTIEVAPRNWDETCKEGTISVLFGLAIFGIAWRAPVLPLHERHRFGEPEDPYACARCGVGADGCMDWERERCGRPGDPNECPF